MNQYRRKVSLLLITSVFSSMAYGNVTGWLSWRGEGQSGASAETNLISNVTVGGQGELWTFPMRGRGTPVIADGKLYVWGYRGEDVDLQEVLVCLDPDTATQLWEVTFNDYISDTIYERYSIGSPTVDSETGNIYLMTTNGQFNCISAAGKILWQISMMETYGRLTFPNGRSGSPVIEDNLVIVRGITSNWGAQGPARDRFYAFDKVSGDLVWSSTPGVSPRDSSFSTPVFGWFDGQRVFYCGTGCGNIVCVNVKTGKPIWRYQFLTGGVNSSVVVYNDDILVAIHGKENIDSSQEGRMVALDLNKAKGLTAPAVLTKDAELWRHDIAMFTSSPVLAGNKIYQVDKTGVLYCIEVESGKMLWKQKLSNAQLHASPLWSDGKLYVPIKNGIFYILKPTETQAQVLCKVKLEGNALGSPSVYNGKVYVHTTEKLYCFGEKGDNVGLAKAVKRASPAVDSTPVQLQVVPSEILLFPNEKRHFTISALNHHGSKVSGVDSAKVSWMKYIPATAKVKVKMNGDFNVAGELIAGSENRPSAGAFKVTHGDLSGTIRGRILPSLPFKQDFESFDLNVNHPTEVGVKFSYPPLPWIGARFKWEIRQLDGNNVLAKTLDRVLFQRALTFIGKEDMKDYTVEVDIMTDGNRRIMSTAGLVNQRYCVVLDGNRQLIEVNSNHSILKVSKPFSWKPKIWYHLKMRVDILPDDSAIVRAKAWPKSQAEPTAWTIEVPHKNGNKQGSPGFFGFSPQSQFSVYLDNVQVTNNN